MATDEDKTGLQADGFRSCTCNMPSGVHADKCPHAVPPVVGPQSLAELSDMVLEPDRDAIAKKLCCYEWSDDNAWSYHSEAGHEKWRQLADFTIRLIRPDPAPAAERVCVCRTSKRGSSYCPVHAPRPTEANCGACAKVRRHAGEGYECCLHPEGLASFIERNARATVATIGGGSVDEKTAAQVVAFGHEVAKKGNE